MKKTPVRSMVDKLVEEGKMNAKNDNCDGMGKYKKK